jgi:hypothetical protein
VFAIGPTVIQGVLVNVETNSDATESAAEHKTKWNTTNKQFSVPVFTEKIHTLSWICFDHPVVISRKNQISSYDI